MAAQTQSAIEGLLRVLATAIKDEVQLMSGVPGDMKFIKDEMDSMNGFLMHLNKMESEHDDQIRAWMKQVREIAYVAEDCVQRYVRMDHHGIDRGGCAGTLATACLFLFRPRTYGQIRELGEQITELKALVHEVSERRQRYDVKVPAGHDRRLVQQNEPSSDQAEERREGFVRALEKELQEEERTARARAQEAPGPSLLGRSSLVIRARTKMQDAIAAVPSAVLGLGNGNDAVAQLPAVVVGRSSEAAATVRVILSKCSCPPAGVGAAEEAQGGGGLSEAEAFRCTKKMFLCALYVYPYPTNAELMKLKEGVVVEAPGVVTAQEARNQVMVFCYSMLSTQQKSCLQYLTAFNDETEISRTSMVRRWVAEGLVGKEPGGGATPEEAGERCFRELLLRGFIRAARRSDAGIVKSCRMDGPVKDFVDGITKSENFLATLPAHLQRQLDIRRIVRRPRPFMPAPRRNMLLGSRYCGAGCAWFDDEAEDDAMDKLVDYIKTLPKLYRLNVMDLGGCTGLRRHHLESFTEVEYLRYLSLRDTDVPRLPHARHMNRLAQLETLDIRGTNIPPRDTMRICLPRLKHLLAGRRITTTTAAETKATMLVTVHMPDRIGLMRDMETLSHVQVSIDGAELQGVAKLQQLRKLGVVVHANTATAAVLGRVLYVLAGCLRSLSVWVVDAVAVAHTRTTTTQQGKGQQGGGQGILDISSMHEIASSLALENLDIKGKMSLPSWIGRAPKLANVTLRDTEMDGGDALRRLAAVLSLRCLKLIRNAFTEQALRFKDVQFQALRFLVVEGDALTRVAFFAGDAAPKLEKIVWAIGGGSTIAQTQNEELIVGIQHLPSLKEIELKASFKVNNLLDWKQQQTTSANPRYSIRYISSTDDQLIIELPKATTDTTLILPAGVIN
ncbi:uncharacterized protein LOC104583052 [Brachypodium distachyon]|uniref:Uncharacterized protein n=1 Tax=Brachypodium distachyon TaxID=15368 RepID=A0A0Q3MGQ1_BRADI|nr:uncharacterized protein LOC104583052 [Brachypodium distachyon]KQK03630.2 hypothetical protein BRADI_2g08990v3 [Brachypodium distachyon]|eukprot:XP_010233035.1 uncharacterized protein LOC104583052 [Brachypodium distachyon]